MTAAKKAMLPDNVVEVTIGTKTYLAKEVPFARIKRFRPLWDDMFKKIENVQGAFSMAAEDGTEIDASSVFDALFEFGIDVPYGLLNILYPDLDREVFEDEENGATFPQLINAFKVGLEVNDLGWLTTQVPFFQNMIRTISLQSTQG